MRNADPTNYELHNEIEMLVAEGLLDRNTPAYKIGQLVVHRGYDSLTDAQRKIYDSVIGTTLDMRQAQREIERVWDRPPKP